MKRKIGDNDAKNKNERVIPLLYGIVINIFGLSTSLLTNSNPVMNHLWLCYVINTLIITLITINWKISAHTFGIASMIAALVFYFNIYFFFLAPLIFIIAWSRMELRIHTFGQVSSGSILGFVLTYIQLYFITILF
ncbi:MAG: phosphatase PAP2 family protein [Ignavibacteriales bacterium]|nr:phosphatase PAP2 family protein [Ignavibacteriales bacterium]